MVTKRSASEQVAYRIEPLLAKKWSDFVADTLIPNRAHYACAMLLYLAASSAQRNAVHRLYARFQRTGQLELPDAVTGLSSGGPVPLAADEIDLLRAYREATEKAKQEAIANLQEQPDSISRTRDTDGRRDHRVG